MNLLVVDLSETAYFLLAAELGEIKSLKIFSCGPDPGECMECIRRFVPNAVVFDSKFCGGNSCLTRSLRSLSRPPVVMVLLAGSFVQYRAVRYGKTMEYFCGGMCQRPRFAESIMALKAEFDSVQVLAESRREVCLIPLLEAV